MTTDHICIPNFSLSGNNKTELAFQYRLKSIFLRWLHEVVINFGIGNLNKLELQILVFEDVIDEQESKVKESEYDTNRYLQFSITFTINGNYLHFSLDTYAH